VQNYDVLEEANRGTRHVIIKLDRLPIAAQQQAFIDPVSHEEECAR